MMFVYGTLFILSCYLSIICNSSTPVVKPGNPLNVLKKYFPKRTGTLQPSSSAVTEAATFVSSVRRPTKRPTRREVYSHSIIKDSPPMRSTLLNGDRSYKDNNNATRDLNAADAFHKFQYMVTKWQATTLKTSSDDNTTAFTPRATVTEANGRAQTGHPLFKGHDKNTWEPVRRVTVTQVNGRALTGCPVSDNGGSPEEAEKYYGADVDQPRVVWKTGIHGSFKVGRTHSDDDDDDDDDDEHQNMMSEDVTY